jgi:hypothetical protein
MLGLALPQGRGVNAMASDRRNVKATRALFVVSDLQRSIDFLSAKFRLGMREIEIVDPDGYRLCPWEELE